VIYVSFFFAIAKGVFWSSKLVTHVEEGGGEGSEEDEKIALTQD
jgi:hypothetical protein